MRSSIIILVLFSTVFLFSCNYATHRTLSDPSQSGKEDPEPDYSKSLDKDYQDFVTYLFLGNRIDNFSTYFNTFYIAQEDFESAMNDYRASSIANYNRRLDSLNVIPVLPQPTKDKFNKVIERASKVIQFHKNSKFIDEAVLLIGRSYYYLTDYPQAERSFNEFLSKLNASNKSDEAILFLGRTKFALGKNDEAINILSELVQKSRDNEIKASATQELGIFEFRKKNYDQAVEYFKSSINFTRDNERKAEREFILAKMYSLFKPSEAASIYSRAVNSTSDYDLKFYSRLNYARGLNVNNDFNRALKELEDIKSKYRDDLTYRQMTDLEIANTIFNQKQYDRAKQKYYEVIIEYPSTIAASDAYFFLGKYYEEVENDYLNALVNYNKSITENSGSDFNITASKKSVTFEKYFTLISGANGTERITVPVVNNELEKFRIRYNETKGIKDPNVKQNEGTFRGRDEGSGKGKPGGYKAANDSLDKDDENNDGDIEGDNDVERFHKEREIENSEKESKVTDPILKADDKFNTYYELAEIFLYELNKRDSAEFYFNKLLNDFPDSEDRVKILYVLATFYKDSDPSRSENLYRQIIEQYPNTQYFSEARKSLGMTAMEISKEPAEDIYKSAMRSLDSGDFQNTIEQLRNIKTNYPESPFTVQSVYTLGWIYENKLHNVDSTIYYYTIIWENYNESEYFIRITPTLEFLLMEKNKALLQNENGKNPETKDPVNENEADNEVKEEVIEEGKEQEPKDEEEGKEKLSQEEIEKLLKDVGE
jgi:tetratricopeptide (TPR) repeat protein